MTPDLQAFLADAAEHPAAYTPVMSLWRAFRRTLDPAAQRYWSRGRLIHELQRAGFQMATYADVLHVVGLAGPVAPQIKDGRLIPA